MTEQNNIWIVDLEAVESRYTGQWKHHFPELLKSVSQAKINVIEGPTDIPEATYYCYTTRITNTSLKRSHTGKLRKVK